MPQNDPRAQFAWPVRVYYEDTDAAGLVYYANYLRYLERARTEWLRTLGFEQRVLAAELGVAFAVTQVSLDYLKPALLDDALQVISSVDEVRRAQMRFAQRIERGEDTLLRASVRVACIDTTTLRPAPLPEVLRERLAR